MTSRLNQLRDIGQSPWLDNLKRSYLTSGELEELRDAGIRGLTSNPSIFQKAIQGSTDYDDQFRQLIAEPGSIDDHYWELVLYDIQGACSVFEPVHADSAGHDGYVSVEVDPRLAHDQAATETAARALHERIDRRNAMIKIPATVEGLPAIEQMIAEGRSVNVTLIFSLDRYQAVMDAYLAGLERLAAVGDGSLSTVTSVGSFFISRVDTEVDRRLDAIGTPEALALKGHAAIAQAKLAYQQFSATFSGDRWNALAKRGARKQRPLWASTGTKNPDYPDVVYVDQLIGPCTVNTLPEATMRAFADHGTVERTIDTGVADAEQVWEQLAGVGVDMDDVAAQLEREGVDSFTTAFDELLDALTTKAAELTADTHH